MNNCEYSIVIVVTKSIPRLDSAFQVFHNTSPITNPRQSAPLTVRSTMSRHFPRCISPKPIRTTAVQ